VAIKTVINYNVSYKINENKQINKFELASEKQK